MQLYQRRTADYIEWFYNEANFPPSNDNADDVRNSIFDVSATVEIDSQIIPPVRNAIWIGTKDTKTRNRIQGIDNVGKSLTDIHGSSSRQHLKEEEGFLNQHKTVHHHQQQHYSQVNVLPGQNRRFHNTDVHHYHTIHERRELEHDENDDPSSSKVDGSRMRTRNLQAATNTTAPLYFPINS